MMATGLGGREEIRSLVPWGPSQKARVGQTAGPGLTGPSVPSPRPQGLRGPGLRNLRAAPGRTHLAGEAPSLPAAPCCHLVASSENSTLLSRIRRRRAPGLGGACWGPPSRASEAPSSPPQKIIHPGRDKISEPLTEARPSSPPPCLSHSSPWMALCLP